MQAGFELQVGDTPEPVFLTTTPHHLSQMDYCLPLAQHIMLFPPVP